VLFTDEDVYKEVSRLSGGERARLMMLVIMLERANTLLLDEPTNHLDLSSKEALDSAVKDFEGTVILVSHDRYFLNKTADRILELTPDGITSYNGNYNDYLDYKNASALSAQSVQAKPVASAAEEYEAAKRKQANIKNLTKKLSATEEKIEQLEENIDSLKKAISDAGADYGKVSELYAECEKSEEELNNLYELWNTLSVELESCQ
jgi:ATP-binding cassette subfamily F protein 3